MSKLLGVLFAKRRSGIGSRISYLGIGILASCLSLSSVQAQEDPDPPTPEGCRGSGLAIALFTSTDVAHVGDTITYSASVFNESFPACRASDIVASITTPDGEVHQIELDRTTLDPGQSDFYEDIVSYTIREQDLQQGEGGKRRFASATGEVDGAIHQNETFSRGGSQQQVNTIVRQPCIDVTLECVPGEGEDGQISYSGTVTNCGDTPLVEVQVVHNVGGTETVLFDSITLDVDESRDFSGSFTPAQPCEAATSEVTATARDDIQPTTESVSDTASATCQLTLSPSIDIDVQCPTNAASPGEDLVYTGTVRNTGDVTLTGVEVVSNQPSSGTVVATIESLAPGATANFSGNLPVAQSCEISTRVDVSAESICGTSVSANASVTCPIETTPAIQVTKTCPDEIMPGEPFNFQGTVENTGNITLRNVEVLSDFRGSNRVVAELGRIEPGEVVEFSQRETAPEDACEVSDTTTVTGVDICSEEEVSDTTSTTCPVQINPAIEVTASCPSNQAAPGDPLNYTGTVRNTGDVTLQNVTVFSARPGPQTEVTVIDTLEAGESQSFSGSFPAPTDACVVENTITAQGASVCGNVNVDDTATIECTVQTNPDIEITASCPTEPVLPGHPLNFTGTIENTGDVTLEGVTATGRFAGETVEVGVPSELAPGQSASFSGTFVVPEGTDACTFAGQFEASGNDACRDATASASTSIECTLETRPAIQVTSECPPEAAAQGSQLTYNGTVKNTGNITLRDVVVVSGRPIAIGGGSGGGTSGSDHPGDSGSDTNESLVEGGNEVFSVNRLEPGETASFSASFEVPADCCAVENTLRGEGVDICTDETVSDTSTTRCPVEFEPNLSITKECPTEPVAPGETLSYSGTVENTGDITLKGVVVYSDVPGREQPILGHINLAPGETADYTASYTVPPDFCGTDTVTVDGTSLCGDKTATDSVTSTCPVETNPKLSVTSNCPTAPLARNQTSTFTGRVVNEGNVTLNDVVVSNTFVLQNRAPSEEREVFGPVSLEPGQSVSFQYEVDVPNDHKCCELVNTLNATGGTACDETVSSTSTSVCPLATQPNIEVSIECPTDNLGVGDWVEYFGVVENTGDITLENVVVVGTRNGTEEQLVGPITLAAGETQRITASFVKEEAGPLAPFVVDASGVDVCNGTSVEDTVGCNTTTGSAGSPLLESISYGNGEVQLTWNARAGASYVVEACPQLNPDNQEGWQVRAQNVTATGAQATWTGEMNGEKTMFFRIKRAENGNAAE